MTEKSYPVTITPLENVRKRLDKNGRKYLSFRAHAETSGKLQERTVRVFGSAVREMEPKLQMGTPVRARVVYDSFNGSKGNHSQTMRLVSLAA